MDERPAKSGCEKEGGRMKNGLPFRIDLVVHICATHGMNYYHQTASCYHCCGCWWRLWPWGGRFIISRWIGPWTGTV